MIAVRIVDGRLPRRTRAQAARSPLNSSSTRGKSSGPSPWRTNRRRARHRDAGFTVYDDPMQGVVPDWISLSRSRNTLSDQTSYITSHRFKHRSRTQGSRQPTSCLAFQVFLFHFLWITEAEHRPTQYRKTRFVNAETRPTKRRCFPVVGRRASSSAGKQIPPKRKSVLPFCSWSLAQRGEA